MWTLGWPNGVSAEAGRHLDDGVVTRLDSLTTAQLTPMQWRASVH